MPHLLNISLSSVSWFCHHAAASVTWYSLAASYLYTNVLAENKTNKAICRISSHGERLRSSYKASWRTFRSQPKCIQTKEFLFSQWVNNEAHFTHPPPPVTQPYGNRQQLIHTLGSSYLFHNLIYFINMLMSISIHLIISFKKQKLVPDAPLILFPNHQLFRH